MNTKETLSPVKRFWLLLIPNRTEIRQLYLFAIINGIVALSLPLGIQSIINLIQGGQVSTSWIVLVILVLLGVLLGGILQIMQLRITENIQQKIFTKAAFEFAYRVPKLKLNKLNNNYAPELMNRFFGIPIVQKGLSKILIDFSTAAFQILLGLILLSFYHPFFIAITLALVVLFFLVFRLTGKRGLDTSLKESKYKYAVVHWLEEIARADKTFKLAGETSLHLKKTDEYVAEYLDARENHFSLLRLQYLWMIAFKIIVAGLLLLIGGMLVINQQMNIGQFVAAELVILLILASVEKLIMSLETIYDVLASLEKVGQVTDFELENDKGSEQIISSDGIVLELNELTFSHENSSKEALKKVSLKINSAEKIMIAGSNGSGKTTLLHLLAGFYEPESGSVCYNGLPAGNYSLEKLRSYIGACFSGASLFHGTVRENISLGKDKTTTEDILRAIAVVGLDEIVKKLPKGLDTLVFPEGKTFSQSTIQKINIARTIVNNPKLLLIDDCINTIETNERKKILEHLLGKNYPATVLIISSDAHVAALCDKVCLMENGSVKAFDQAKNMEQELLNLIN
ncbi:MAG: putative multidrug export ATP-binding/permease protein [Bacteroidia bacterium]|nr:putative multidrug export ATP-binding/permease protein [Bacteroidia bacterium]